MRKARKEALAQLLGRIVALGGPDLALRRHGRLYDVVRVTPKAGIRACTTPDSLAVTQGWLYGFRDAYAQVRADERHAKEEG